jgi:flagellar hook-length control protein FliK
VPNPNRAFWPPEESGNRTWDFPANSRQFSRERILSKEVQTMQVNLAATALSALGLEAIVGGKGEEASEVAFASQTEAATSTPTQKDLTTVDEALASALARALNSAPETEAKTQPSTTQLGAEADPADAPILTTVAEPMTEGTEAASSKTPALLATAVGDVALTQESDLANLGTTAAGTSVAIEAQETSVAGASTVPPHADPEVDSPLPAFVPAEASEAANGQRSPAPRETEAASAPAKPNPDHSTTPVTAVRERAVTEARHAPETTARPLPARLENMLSRMPTELREAITSVREMAHTMLSRGARVGEVVSAIRAAVAAAVRETGHPGVATHDRASTGALIADVVAQFRRGGIVREPVTSVAEASTTAETTRTAPTVVGDAPIAPETEAAFADSPLLSKRGEPTMTTVRTLFQQESSEAALSVEPKATTVAQEPTGEVPSDAKGTPIGTPMTTAQSSDGTTVVQRATEARYAPVIQKVTDQIADLAGTTKKSLTLRLDPPELGTVDITIHSRGSKIEAHVLASNADVRSALHVNRQALTEALAQHGLELSSLLVGDDRSGSSAHRFTEAANQAPAYRFESESAVAEAVARSAVRWNWTSTALDLKV